MNSQVLKRLNNELGKNTEISDIIINGNNISFIYKSFSYEFNIPKFYPFKGPYEFYENNIKKNYSNILQNLKDLYFKFYKSCPCCDNLLCPSNWSPKILIIDVINEYHTFERRLILLEKIDLLLKKTRYKRIPEEVDIKILSFIDLNL